MSAQPATRGRGLLASALSAAAGWLVEPAPEAAAGERDASRLAERPVVAVVGLASRCGTTTVARALGAELAMRDAGGACAVTATAIRGGVPLGLPAAGRLVRRLAPVSAGRTGACGRLCLVTDVERTDLAHAVARLAPLVLDVDDPSEASAAAAIADRVVVVAGVRSEPGLAALLAESLARVGPYPLLVCNRSQGEQGPLAGRLDLELPDSRMGAALALAGREPRGELGRAVAELADRVGEVR